MPYDRYYIVFISSTSDLDHYRGLSRAALLDKWYIPIGMEGLPSDPNPPRHQIEEFIRRSDAVLLLVGSRYGSRHPDEDMSYVEWEYKFAQQVQKPVFPLISNILRRDSRDQDSARQEKFVDLLKHNTLADFFDDEASFVLALNRALSNMEHVVPEHGGLIRSGAAIRLIENSRQEIQDLQSKLSLANRRVQELEALRSSYRRSQHLVTAIGSAVVQVHLPSVPVFSSCKTPEAPTV